MQRKYFDTVEELKQDLFSFKSQMMNENQAMARKLESGAKKFEIEQRESVENMFSVANPF